MINTQKNKRYIYNRKLLPKKIRILFSFIEIFLCLDFGFIKYKSPKMKFCSKLGVFVLYLCLGITIVDILLGLDKFYLIWGIKFLLEYYFYILILFYTPEKSNYCFYLMKLQYFDEKIGVESSMYKLDTKIILFWFSSCVINGFILGFFFISGFNDEVEVFLNLLYFVPLLTYNLPLIVFFFVFYSMYCRVKQLKIFIQNRKSSVLRAHQLYKYLIDCIERVMKCFRSIFLVSLFFNIPGIMASIYLLIKTIQETDQINFTLFVPYIPLLHKITVKAVPTVAASWLSQEAIDIKLLLHNQLLEESDVNEAQDMERFIEYIETRPFKFYLLTMIPMDTALLVMVLDFYITYLLVIIQFTHIY